MEENKEIEKRKKDLIQELALLCGYDLKEDNSKTSKEELEEKRKVNVKNYLENFDKDFNTHVQEKIKETPLLLNIFQNFIQNIYEPSKLYKVALKTQNNIYNEMSTTLTEEQLNLFEQWKFCEERMSEDMIEQAFIYGFSMSYQLKDEATKNNV